MSTYKQLIMDILVNPQVRKLVPGISNATLTGIESWLGTMKGQFYLTSVDAVFASPGLKIQDRKVMLDNDWGVKLVGTQHAFINKPTNVRFTNNRLCLTTTAELTSTGSCAVLDPNLNLMTVLGRAGTSFNTGEFTRAGDMTFDPITNKYLVACPDDHIIQRYDAAGVYVDTLGTPGVSGQPVAPTVGNNGLAFTTPVAVGTGDRGFYVACDTITGGFITQIRKDLSANSIPLYPGKNGGAGKIFEGEISHIKDMVVLTNPDKLLILNGTDEIGIFDVDAGFKLETVINIPSEIYSTSLGLNRITADASTIYVSASATGEIIAIDRKTGKYIGKFGELRNESTLNSDHTLGCFNGLSGITISSDRLVTTESINNRVQSFGTALCRSPKFAIDFTPVVISDTAQMQYITVPAGTVIPQEVRVVDRDLNTEFTVETAIARKTKRFFVRFYLKPSSFSLQKKAMDLFPIHVLCEDTN